MLTLWVKPITDGMRRTTDLTSVWWSLSISTDTAPGCGVYLCCGHCAVLQETPCGEELQLLQTFCRNTPGHVQTSPLKQEQREQRAVSLQTSAAHAPWEGAATSTTLQHRDPTSPIIKGWSVCSALIPLGSGLNSERLFLPEGGSLLLSSQQQLNLSRIYSYRHQYSLAHFRKSNERYMLRFLAWNSIWDDFYNPYKRNIWKHSELYN